MIWGMQLLLWAVSIAVTVGITLVGVRLTRERRQLMWLCAQTEIARAGEDDRLTLLYDGIAVNRISVARIGLINAGNHPLRFKEDLEQPLVIRPPDGARLLHVRVAKVVPPELQVNDAVWDSGGAALEFASLDVKEYIVVEVVHDDPKGRAPTVEGRILGGSLVTPKETWWPILVAYAIGLPSAAGGGALANYVKTLGWSTGLAGAAQVAAYVAVFVPVVLAVMVAGGIHSRSAAARLTDELGWQNVKRSPAG